MKAVRQLHQWLLISEDEVVSVIDEQTGDRVERRAGDVWTPAQRFVGADGRTVLMHAAEHYVARPLTDVLRDSPACVQDRAFEGESVPPGKMRIGILPNSLESVCYLSVALALADQVSTGVCADPTCARPFIITDKRQKFCSRNCGNRVRLRRFTHKRRAATTRKEVE